MDKNDQINNTAIANNSTNLLKPNSLPENQEFNNYYINQLNIPRTKLSKKTHYQQMQI